MQDSASARVRPLSRSKRPTTPGEVLGVLAEDPGAENGAEVRLHRRELRLGVLRLAPHRQVELDLARRREDRDGVVLPLRVDRGHELLDGGLPHAGDAQHAPPPDDAARPARAGRAGRSSSMISFISEGTPGRMTISLPSRSAQKPGAVPRGFSRTRAPTMKSACFALQAGIAKPRRAKRWRIFSRNASLRSSRAPSQRATAATVTSSAVGPSPPVVKT